MMPVSPKIAPVGVLSLSPSWSIGDSLKDFPRSGIDTVIPLAPKILHPINSLRDFSRQLVQFSD
jgi:hypothetical protein